MRRREFLSVISAYSVLPLSLALVSNRCQTSSPQAAHLMTGRFDPLYPTLVQLFEDWRGNEGHSWLSVARVQRHLRIGYQRACTLVEAMVHDGLPGQSHECHCREP